MKTQETQDTEEKLWSKIKNTLTVHRKKRFRCWMRMATAGSESKILWFRS